jgi:hypothetical protein
MRGGSVGTPIRGPEITEGGCRAAEYPDNIYFIQSSDKHNKLMQQDATC